MSENKMSFHKLFVRQANDELRRLAADGMRNFHRDRNRLADRVNLDPDGCGNLLKPGENTCQINYLTCVENGIFAKMNIFEIFALCFEPDAIKLLLESSGNGYQFWHYLNDLWLVGLGPFEGAKDFDLPITRSCLEELLAAFGPFGINSGAQSKTLRLARLEKLIAEGFDVDKLDPVYATELLDAGFLLLYMPDGYPMPSLPAIKPRLVISPLFRKLVPGYEVPSDVDRRFVATD